MDYSKWNIWNPKNEPLDSVNITNDFKISLCITCMNRIHDLLVTLPQNLKDNPYKNLEIVVLDYNSAIPVFTQLKKQLPKEIESGRVVVFRTEEPCWYSMTHSRNVAFRLATGDIVNSVDADNFVCEGFVETINKMANLCRSKAVFAKGKRGIHGRLGFWKNEFIELGGYNEELEGYGHDDHDLLERAMISGFKLMWYGGKHCVRIKTPNKDKGKFMKEKNWKITEKRNKDISQKNISNGILVANPNGFGKGVFIKNNEKEIVLG